MPYFALTLPCCSKSTMYRPTFQYVVFTIWFMLMANCSFPCSITATILSASCIKSESGTTTSVFSTFIISFFSSIFVPFLFPLFHFLPLHLPNFYTGLGRLGCAKIIEIKAIAYLSLLSKLINAATPAIIATPVNTFDNVSSLSFFFFGAGISDLLRLNNSFIAFCGFERLNLM